jgi:hypothetical protein
MYNNVNLKGDKMQKKSILDYVNGGLEMSIGHNQ